MKSTQLFKKDMILLQFSLSQSCFTGRDQHFLLLVSCVINYNSLEKSKHYDKKIPWSQSPRFNRAAKLYATLAKKKKKVMMEQSSFEMT